MTKIVITVPGERVVQEFEAQVAQPTTPSPLSPPPKIGLVEVSQSTPTELIPGPMGPAGSRGTRWTTGDGAPTSTAGVITGDIYLDDILGAVWQWDGSAWLDTGTNIQGSPDTGTDILGKLAPVDGSGSGLDADMVDGQHAVAFAQQTALAAEIINRQNADTAEATARANADTAEATARANADTAEITARQNADTALQGQIDLKAPIASPTLTGDPKSVTPATSDNDTSIATTAYVKANIAALPPAGLSDAPSDGLTYGRKNATWATIVGGAIVSDTPPPGPLQTGQLWWSSATGNTFIWYLDAAGPGQWVQVNVSGTQLVPTAQARSRVANGAMQISQENGNTGSAQLAALAYYVADQWIVVSSTSPGTAAAVRGQLVTPNGSVNRARIQVFTAKAALAAGDYLGFQTSIEGNRVADFMWGSAQAKQVIVRFGFKGPAGTYSLAVTNGPANRTYVANFTVAAGQANADTVQTFVLPGDITGTWPTDTSRGMYFNIFLAAGTTWQGVAGWQAGNFFGTAASSNGMATAGNVFELFDVGLYLDPQSTGAAPPWQIPDEAQELQACQRYYYRVTPGGSTLPFGAGYALSATVGRAVIPYGPMRITPTGSFGQAPTDFAFVTTTGFAPSAITLTCGAQAATVDTTVTGMTAGHGGYLRAASANAWLAFNARM